MKQMSGTYQQIRQSVDAIRSRASSLGGITQPQIGLILGSGLGEIADQLEGRVVIPYAEIPGFHGTSIEGHAGEMVLGKFEGVPMVCLKGRFHLYEGYDMNDVVFPTRAICGLGIETLFLTNAAGGVNKNYNLTDLMLIEDHINLMGDNPLKGPHLRELGPRFPDLTEAYHRDILQKMEAAADKFNISCHRGVYAGLLGPTYETPAEIRMLRTLGADAVGMSTVPESIAANHLGVRVAGISCITNMAAGISKTKLTHEEVIENSRACRIHIERILREVMPQLTASQHTQQANQAAQSSQDSLKQQNAKNVSVELHP